MFMCRCTVAMLAQCAALTIGNGVRACIYIYICGMGFVRLVDFPFSPRIKIDFSFLYTGMDSHQAVSRQTVMKATLSGTRRRGCGEYIYIYIYI